MYLMMLPSILAGMDASRTTRTVVRVFAVLVSAAMVGLHEWDAWWRPRSASNPSVRAADTVTRIVPGVSWSSLARYPALRDDAAVTACPLACCIQSTGGRRSGPGYAPTL